MDKLTEREMERQCSHVGDTCNHYGGVAIINYKGNMFWGIEYYDGYKWEEIPEYLYAALLRFTTDKAK